ncbi:MAG: ATP-binding cassette domain-containing protein [Limnobacter sp.]|nr:ATP-binding cassette domain-containing protein [Limnobacter sp.]
MNKPVLHTTGLSKSFKGISSADRPTQVIEGLDLQVFEAETVAIVGASGAGKSTLLHVLGGLDKPDQGQVFWDGQAIAGLSVKQLGKVRNKQLGFIYQFHHLLPEFSATDNVAMPLRIGGQPKVEAQARARDILQKLGLEHRLNHRPAELSGGERQRVAIARALVTQPRAILADEPTGNLDQGTADVVFNSLLELNAQHRSALVMVTHSMDLARRCQRILKLSKGKLTEEV